MNNLSQWLGTLRERGITASHDNGTVTLHGAAVTPLDHDWLDRHHDALTIGATGTHPAWWDAISTGHPEHITPHDTPNQCVARGCPGELTHYDPQGVPFCDQHPPAWWHTHLPTKEAAA